MTIMGDSMNDLSLKEIDKNLAIPFIHNHHYSKILPRLTKYHLGCFYDNELCGVITLGWGTQPLQTIKKIFYNHIITTKDYLEIGKMCFLPKMNNSNFGSSIIKILIEWLKQNTDCQYLYTLADGIMGKCGYVYQASNFIYIGSFKTSVYMNLKTGEKIHPRSAKTLLQENAVFSDKDKVFWLTDDFCEHKGIDKINGLMFRYMFPLNKKARKILNSYTEYNNLKNPKDSDLIFQRRIKKGKFENIEQPNFNMNVFQYNYQKYNDVEEKEVKQIEKIIRFKTDKMIDLVTLMEKEPQLFEELATDYPSEKATYIFEVNA